MKYRVSNMTAIFPPLAGAAKLKMILLKLVTGDEKYCTHIRYTLIAY